MSNRYKNSEGKIAVIISPEYGAGFSTWNPDKSICFNPEMVKYILDNDEKSIQEWCEKNGVYNPKKYKIEWVDEGQLFEIVEYDGLESIALCNDKNWLKA